MNKKLDFVVIGVQKCATTWLYDCLFEHPELDLRNEKTEIGYYGGDQFKINGEEYYFNKFKNNGNKKGCVSVEYIEDANIPKILFEHNPDIKIIVSLRDPIDRIVSAYNWYLRKAAIPELALNDGLQIAVDSYFSGSDSGSKYFDLIQRGFYFDHINRFLDYFSLNNIMFVLYDEIKNDPKKTIIDIESFLQISSFIPNNINSKPKLTGNSSFLIRFQRVFSSSKVVGKFVDILNQKLSSSANSPSSKSKIEPHIIKNLQNIYNDKNLELFKILKDEKLINIIRANWNI